MINIFKAILYGIVEGITEWLPISSTGHMILLDEFLKLDVSDAFWELFLVVIQLGAILAVIILFFNKLNPISFKKDEPRIKKPVLQIWAKVLIACVPAAIIGLILDDFLNSIFYNFITVSITLILYGIIFIVVEKFIKKKEDFKVQDVAEISYKTALFIGLFQLLALIPGTSRSGVTIIGALLLGCSRTSGAEFSFYLSIPVMLGASLLKGVKFFVEGNTISGNEALILIVACLTALAVSLICIKGLMSFIKKHDFKIFGIYRIILGIILIVYFIIKCNM